MTNSDEDENVSLSSIVVEHDTNVQLACILKSLSQIIDLLKEQTSELIEIRNTNRRRR